MAHNGKHCFADTGGSQAVTVGHGYCGRRVPDGAVEACMWYHRSDCDVIEDEGYIAWGWRAVVMRNGLRRGVRVYNCFG
jgi:hypothetical protein